MDVILERSSRVSEFDVVNIYKVFLGRPPESQNVIADNTGLTLEQLLRHVLKSEEFLRHVVGLILTGEIVNSPRYAGHVSSDLNVWAKTIFDINKTLDEIADNTLWSRLLMHIVDALRSVSAADLIEDIVFSNQFKEALINWSRVERSLSIIGGLDLCDSGRVVGWILDRDRLESDLVVEVFANGRFAGATRADKFRRDLQAAYGGDGVYGFSIDLKYISNINDRRPIKIELFEAITRKVFASANIETQVQPSLDALDAIAHVLKDIKKSIYQIESQIPALRNISSFSTDAYNSYLDAYGHDLSRHKLINQDLNTKINLSPLVSVIVSVPDDALSGLRLTIESILNQIYEKFELIVVYCAPKVSTQSMPWIDSLLASSDAPTRQLWPEARQDLGAATSSAIQSSVGDFVCCIESGDFVPAGAVRRLVKAINAHPQSQVFYSDEDQFDRVSEGHFVYSSPKFNARYDPLRMTQAELCPGLIALEGQLIRTLDASQALEREDAFIRLIQICDAAAAHGIEHIAQVMLHRSRPRTPPTAVQLERRRGYIQARQDSRGEGGRVEVSNDPLGAVVPGGLRIAPTGLDAVTATVIIPTRDNLSLLRPCIEGLINTRENNSVKFDIIVVDNGSKDEGLLDYLISLRRRIGVDVVRDERPFNWAALNNAAAARCTSEVLVFLNDDMLPIVGEWCDELCFWALRADAGPVGTRLLYEDGSIQHAGVLGGVFGLAAHEGVGAAGDDPGYLGRHALVRKTMAVTGACMAVRRSVFEQLGGFDADTFAVTYNDIDFCLRAAQAGFDTIYTPYASFYHFESKSRGFDFLAPPLDQMERSKEAHAIISRWGDRLLKDATYNPHFDRWSRPFTRLTAVDRD